MRTVTATALGLTVTLLMSACMSMKPAQPEKTVDGLVRIPTKRIDTAYAAPGMTLASYRRVMLDPVHVAFKRNWQRSHPELTAQDLARIRSQAAALFRDVFARELDDKGGYALTDQPGPDVLRVTASIVDLDISAPQAGSQAGTRSYVVSPGEMTLLAELRDSESGAILVRAADHERGRDFGNLQIANEVTNSAEAQRAFAMWAGLLRVALDDARAATPPAR